MMEDRMDDPLVFPSREILSERLGRAYAAFEALFASLGRDLAGFTDTWRYYRDGKSWLLNAAVKGKTIFWLSAARGRFDASFYLPASEEDAVSRSLLPETAKEAFRASAKGKKSGCVTLEIRTKKDLEGLREALALKLAAMKPKARRSAK